MAALLLVVGKSRALGESLTVAAGETKTLTADLVLGPGDSLTAMGTAASRCTIEGQGFQIKAEAFEGSIAIGHCTLHGLGTGTKPGFDLSLGGNAAVQIADSTFTQSGQTVLTVGGNATVDILRDDFAADLLVDPMPTSFEKSVPAVLLSGQGTGLKRFQGNRVLVSYLKFDHAASWRVGGLTEAEGNVFYGQRAGIYVQASQGLTIQGNYLRTPAPWTGLNQLTSLGFGTGNTDILVEHNVLRGGNSIVEGGFDGELRYNLIADPHAAYGVGGMSWTAKMRVHHNLITRSEVAEVAEVAEAANTAASTAPIYAFYVGDLPTLPEPLPAPTIELFNNTVDWGDCYPQAGGAVGVGRHTRIKSLRNNLFMRFSYPSAAIAVVDAFPLPAPAEDPGPAVFDDLDYNAFDNEMVTKADNYSASVAGKTERIDTGFAAHDLAVAGAKDQQVDANLRGRLPVHFPFSDESLAGRSITVCQVLKFYRAAYSPLSTSPLLGHGAPMDGSGVAIGAVGDGTGADAQDQFGIACPADVTLLAAVTDSQATCASPGAGGSGAGGAGAGGMAGAAGNAGAAGTSGTSGAAGSKGAGGWGGTGATAGAGGSSGTGGIVAAAGAGGTAGAGNESGAGGTAGSGAAGGAGGGAGTGGAGTGGSASPPSGIFCVCAVAESPSLEGTIWSAGFFVALLSLRRRGPGRAKRARATWVAAGGPASRLAD